MTKRMLAVGQANKDGVNIDTGEGVPVPDDFAGMAAYLDAMQESGQPMDWDEFDSWTNEPGHKPEPNRYNW